MAKPKMKPEGVGGQSAVIEQISTAELIPYARNARTHSEQQVQQIAGSIQEFGFCNPVLIDATNGIIAGHGRVMAAQLLKLESVPCLRLSHLTDAQKRAYVLADNRIALSSGWNTEMLANELSDLHADDFDMALLGFDADELATLLGMEDTTGQGSDITGEIVEDEVPEPPADPITKPGDLWILGSHRLLCGDSESGSDVTRLMEGVKADLCLTDPPYGINADRQHFEGHGWTLREKTEWDKKRPSQKAINACIEISEEQIIWGGNYFADMLSPSMGWLVWDKGQREFSLADCELAWRSKWTAIRCLTLSRSKATHESERVHPTQKPVSLMTWCVEQSGDVKTIADLFLGSGTTLIAAEQLNRKCFGMEISPAYCDVIVKRWENLTGKTATLEAA